LQGIRSRVAHPANLGRRHVNNRTKSSLNAVDAETSAAQVLYQIPKRLIGDRIVGRSFTAFLAAANGSAGIVTSVRLAIRYLLPIVNQWRIFYSFCQEPSR
jgi:hypothetical protein